MHERSRIRSTPESCGQSIVLNRDGQGQRSNSTHPLTDTLDKNYRDAAIVRYIISAQPRTTELPRFWKLLNNGTIAKQEPDGQEIVASMKRAVIFNGSVEWTETCFCSPPLKHERTTVYDQFFENMQIKPLESPVELKGERFWDNLRNASGHAGLSVSPTLVASQVKYVPLRIL